MNTSNRGLLTSLVRDVALRSCELIRSDSAFVSVDDVLAYSSSLAATIGESLTDRNFHRSGWRPVPLATAQEAVRQYLAELGVELDAAAGRARVLSGVATSSSEAREIGEQFAAAHERCVAQFEFLFAAKDVTDDA